MLGTLLLSAILMAGDGWVLTDIDGKRHTRLESAPALVLVFIGTDCPIANFYQPTLARLAREYDGIGWFLVHSDPDLTSAAAREHARHYKIAAPVVLDPDQSMARRVGARFTPEAVVVGREGEILYRGRIDNTYEAFGKKRARATRHDLREALDAVLAGKAVQQTSTPVVGCHIWFAPRP